MTFTATAEQPIRITPPLAIPLQLRPPDGLFGMPRVRVAVLPTTARSGRPWENLNASGLLPDMPAALAAIDYDPDAQYPAFSTHEAVDLTAPVGTAVFAARNGTVTVSTRRRRNSPFGTDLVVIDHHLDNPGFVTRYLHLRERFVAVGQDVGEGQIIGLVGDNEFGSHLHFELLHEMWRLPEGQVGHERLTLPLDPTRALYRADQNRFLTRFVGLMSDTSRVLPEGSPLEPQPVRDSEPPSARGRIRRLRVSNLDGLPFFTLRLEPTESERPDVFDIPLYEPCEPVELQMVEQLRALHAAGSPVQLRYRISSYWGESRNLLLSVRGEG